jgi:hypothetical protein
MSDFNLFAMGFEVDEHLGQVVVVLEGEVELLHSFFHLDDIDDALVQVRVD